MSLSSGGRAGHLPAELTSFVGRRQVAKDARQLLSAARLLTLIGPGGVGKTRLALRVGAEVRRVFSDGVWLVELDQLRNPELLVQTVASALGLRQRSAEWPMDILRDYLAPRHLLLVLDNCEHVIDPCAKLVDGLLRHCPYLRILTTSREPLNIVGEATLAVPPLSLSAPGCAASSWKSEQSEAVRLFVDRARSVAPEFRLTEENYPAVAGICRRLDGLPLAIELAAARVRVLGPSQILHRLEQPFGLLTRGSRIAPPRHQTLRACVEWSYDLCTAAERTLWASLACFTGDFDLEAAEAVGGDGDLAGEEVFDVVCSLVDKSVLAREEHAGVSRFQLLEVIREFGLEKLKASGKSTVVHRRYRDYYEELARRMEADWIGPRQADWLSRLDREHSNLRTALTFCLTEPDEARHALSILGSLPQYYWWTRGLLTEGRYWLGQALDRVSEPALLRVRGLLLDIQLSIGQGAFHPDALHEAWQLAQRLDNPRVLAFASYVAGIGALWSGDLPAARSSLQKAFAIASNGVDPDIEIEALVVLATTYGLSGDHERMMDYVRAVRERTQPCGEIFHRMYATWSAGVAAWRQGDLARATHLQREALRWAVDLDDRNGVAWCLDPLAWIAAAEGRNVRAATLLGAAGALWDALGTSPEAFRDLHGDHLACGQRARDALGDTAFETAGRHGTSLSLGQAVAYALDDTAQIATAPVEVPPSSAGAALTRRERQVADLIARGRTNKEIARSLVISQRTAETHVEHILLKLGFTSRTQVAAWITAHSTKSDDR